MSDQPAPAGLDLVIGFVNTRDDDEGTDALASPELARQWLAQSGLPGLGATPSARELERLVSLREALRALLSANNTGAPPPPDGLAALNREASEMRFGLRFDGGGGEIFAAGSGVDAVIAALLAIIHDSMRVGTWGRLKVCYADSCIWAFYDHSRNRSATWCRMEECGNREKARTYRERRRAASKPGR